jgi:hypothetical protein
MNKEGIDKVEHSSLKATVDNFPVARHLITSQSGSWRLA